MTIGQEVDHYCHIWSACWVFSCFQNPPISDAGYMIFSVRMWSFVVRAHGGWAQRVSTTYLTRKIRLRFWYASDGIGTRVTESQWKSDALPTEPPRHHVISIGHVRWINENPKQNYIRCLFARLGIAATQSDNVVTCHIACPPNNLAKQSTATKQPFDKKRSIA